MRHYRGLRPELDVFVFDNGEERSLLNLNGTIPVDYRGSSYNIPVCFWLLHDYPTSAPMGFVRPTQVGNLESMLNSNV
jgi:ESCRT-I complex subunit TSG101